MRPGGHSKNTQVSDSLEVLFPPTVFIAQPRVPAQVSHPMVCGLGNFLLAPSPPINTVLPAASLLLCYSSSHCIEDLLVIIMGHICRPS